MNSKNLVIVFLAFISINLATSAAFDKIKVSGQLSCSNPETKGTLKFIKGAPNGDYKANFMPLGDGSSYVSVGSAGFGSESIVDFKIPKHEPGLDVDLKVDEAALKELGSFSDMVVDLEALPGDDVTSFTGFGFASGSVVITDDGCSESSGNVDTNEDSNFLEDGVESVDLPEFPTILVSDVIDESGNSLDKDLTVDLTYKVDKALYDLFVGNLGEGDVTEKAKELAKRFGIQLKIKNLRKLARKEIKDATKGLKGDEKKGAAAQAKAQGINKLLDTILLKIPPRVSRKEGQEARDKNKKIRQAKRKQILEALTVELKSVTDGKEGEKEVKCLKFSVTLPAKVCPAKTKKSKKTLVLGNRKLAIQDLAPGESISVNLEVKVTGFFAQFFSNNGVIEMPITVSNPI